MSNSKKPQILVADASRDSLESAQHILQHLPVGIIYVESAKEAFEALVNGNFILAILDVQMPNIDGYELAKCILNNSHTENIPIILLTAIPPSDTVWEYKSGYVDYLFKPFNQDQLISKVKFFLKTHQRMLHMDATEKHLATTVLDEATDGYWDWHVHTKQFFNSVKFKYLLGYTDSEIPNTLSAWKKLLFIEDVNKATNFLKNIHFHKTSSIELRFVHKRGDIISLLCRHVKVETNTTSSARIIGTYTNITNVKKTEEKLKSLSNEFENFAYITSHDLRAPLRGIENLMTWISRDDQDKLSSKSKDYFEKAIQQVARMNDLINGILSYSRLTTIDKIKKQICIYKIVNKIAANQCDHKTVSINITGNFPVIYGCETQLYQLFYNLINNAIEHNDKEKINITIHSEVEFNSYAISIADNSPGIDRQYHDKVFQLFQTLQPKSKTNSTGIGLTMAKKIVDLYNGKIEIDSTIGMGTNILLSFPKYHHQTLGAAEHSLVWDKRR